MVRTDPTGLVEWTGVIRGSVLSNVFGAGLFEIELTSECVAGRRATATIWAIGPTLGLGALLDTTVSNVTVNDRHIELNPSTLNGYFQLSTIGVTPGIGYGAYAIAIGTDGSRTSPTGATGFGHGRVTGLGTGASTTAGSSTITSLEYEDCSCQ